MGLFSKKTKTQRLLEFNKDKLQKDINNLSNRIFDYRKDLGLQIIQEVIELAKNIEVLELASAKDESDMQRHKGRLQAFTDLSAYILNSLEFHKQEDKQTPRGTIKMARRTSNQAGVSL
jgi:hypothetical protein